MRAKTRKKQRRWIDPEEFRIARRRAGLDREAAADMLHVTVKTLQNWEESRSPVPYAAFRVMRLMGGYLLAGDAWEGWSLNGNKLFSPEGRSFQPHELRYIGNYFTMARLFLKSRQSLQSSTSKTPAASALDASLGVAADSTAARGNASGATAPSGVRRCHETVEVFGRLSQQGKTMQQPANDDWALRPPA